MKQKDMLQGFIFVILVLLLTLPGYSSVQKSTVRVIVENASIRLKPDLQSEIIKTPPLGSVFEVEKKEGDWYEIRVKTELGVSLPGFIHEMYVESVEAEKTEPAPIKKVPETKKEAVWVPPPSPPPTKTIPQKSASKFVFFINGNYSGGYSIGDTVYSRSYNITRVSTNDNGDIIATMPSGLFGGSTGFSFFFTKSLGISVSASYLRKGEVTLAGSYIFDWTWTSSGNSYDREGSWEDLGSFSVIPISLNLTYRMAFGNSTFLTFSGGPSIFFTNVELNSMAGFGDAWTNSYTIWPITYTTTTIEWFEMDVFINQKETIFGGNIGLDFEQKIAGFMGIFVGFKYFIAPTRTYMWEENRPTTYYGVLDNYDWTPTSADVGPNITHFPKVDVKFSQWMIVVGFTFHISP